MKNTTIKNTKKSVINKIKNVKTSFSAEKITNYAGLSLVAKYINKVGLIEEWEKMFPTIKYNATKFSTSQVLMAFVFGFMSGVHRISRISRFTQDDLVKTLLQLPTRINKDALSTHLKRMGEKGAEKLRRFHLSFNNRLLKKSGLTSITLDADSTYLLTYGHQEGAEKSYHPKKKGHRTYHPLLVFLSELKILYHSRFRKGSTYTSVGIVELLKEIKAGLPGQVKKVFFRADSGFFSLETIHFIESIPGWTYLIKFSAKNLKNKLAQLDWQPIEGQKNMWQCTFEYTFSRNKGKMVIKAIRTLVKEEERDFFDKKELVPVYEYAAYASNLELDPYDLHKKYTQRATSETWIEQVKSQLMAGKTLTNQFAANDILWQLSVWAYNISIMMRWGVKKFWKWEHNTFRYLLLQVAGKVVKSGRQCYLKMSRFYLYKDDWLKLEEAI